MEKEKSFTLVELLIIIAIIGLLTTLIIAAISGTFSPSSRAKVAKALEYSGSIYSLLGADLLGQWMFDNGTGTIAYDTSGNGNNGTLTNGPVYATDTPQAVAGSGNGKYSLSFDGIDDYVSIPNSSGLTLGNAITIEAWINAKQITGHSSNQFRIANKMTYPNSGWYLLYYSSGNFQFWTYDGSGHGVYYYITPSLNTWYHVVGVSDGTQNKIYVNGKISSMVRSSGTLTNSTNVLALSSSATDYSWNGFIDDVRVYGVALTAYQVQQHYAEGLSRHQLTIK